MFEGIGNFLVFAMYAAIGLAVLSVALRESRNRDLQWDVRRRGVEVEAEILGRFEAGAPQGSEMAKARQPMMASWDPLELELRYVFGDREIVSRGRVSVKTFFHSRGMKTLKVKVLPEQPEKWAALV